MGLRLKIEQQSKVCVVQPPLNFFLDPPLVDGFIYDGNEVDLDASKDADFLMEPCSKSKKKSLKKVEIFHIYAEVSVYSFTL